MFVEVTSREQINIVEALAGEIWTEHYIPIIGRDQVEYMLDRFQSSEAISHQIESEGYRYFLMEEKGKYIGYMSVQIRGSELFLSKIYVVGRLRGKGFGKKAVRFLEDFAANFHLRKIALTVNKNNKESIAAYEKMGFTNLGPVVQDIGNGFIMDDFRMEKIVPMS